MRVALGNINSQAPITYTGWAKDWPAGLYQGVRSSNSFVVVKDRKAVFFRDGGDYMNTGPGLGQLFEDYRQLPIGTQVVLTA